MKPGKLYFNDGENYVKSIKDELMLTRYLEKIELCENIDPYQIQLDQCVKSYSTLPKVTGYDIVYYMVSQTNFYTMSDFKLHGNLNSFKHFQLGAVEDIVMHEYHQDNILVLANVKAIPELNHGFVQCWLLCGRRGEILSGHCTCMNGPEKACRHIATILFAIEFLVISPRAELVSGLFDRWPLPTFKNQILTSSSLSSALSALAASSSPLASVAASVTPSQILPGNMILFTMSQISKILMRRPV